MGQVDDEFGYGPRWAWHTTCCGKPVGCTNMSDQCLLRNHPWKQRNNVTDLVGFVTARLDEKEAAARHAGPGTVAWLSVHDDAGQFRYTTVAATSGDSDDVWCADGRALPEPASARVIYDPARVLREVAAGRALLAEYAPVAGGDGSDEPEYASGWATGLGMAVRALAAAWSDHPQYQPVWALAQVRPGPG